MTNSSIALARRFWMHVHEGGTLTARDVGRMVEALEDVFQMYVDANEARIDAEEKLRKSALQELSALGQASEAYQAQLAAEAKLSKCEALLAKAVGLLEKASPFIGYNAHVPDIDLAVSDFLAELEGQDDE